MLEITGLQAFYGDAQALHGVDVTVGQGEVVTLVGRNGAGKTTLVNLVMRFYELDGGRILLDGVDIATVPRAQLRSQVGMVLQGSQRGEDLDHAALHRQGSLDGLRAVGQEEPPLGADRAAAQLASLLDAAVRRDKWSAHVIRRRPWAR